MKTHSTIYIEAKWELEGGIDITEEEWMTIWAYQWKCSSSQSWREFGWKSLIRYFITPLLHLTKKVISQLAREIVEIQMQIIIMFFGTVRLLRLTGREYIMQYRKYLEVTCP